MKLKNFFKKHWLAISVTAGSLIIVAVAIILVAVLLTQTAITDTAVYKITDRIISESEEINIEIDSQAHLSGDYGGEAYSINASELSGIAGTAKAIGIDVSVWQGTIEWDKVKAAGIDFAMIRCGYRGYSGSGVIEKDPRFDRNIVGALNAGIKVGVYFYSTAVTVEEAEQEADWVISVIKDYNITYPVAYDFEEFYNSDGSRAVRLSQKQRTANTVAFLERVKSAGYNPMLYASASAVRRYWLYSEIKEYDYWLAHYTTKTNYSGHYVMWQCTSKGRIDGINGNVDFNIAYKSF